MSSNRKSDSQAPQGGLLNWCASIEGTSISHYLQNGGFRGAARAAAMEPLEVVSELRRSGLRSWLPGQLPVFAGLHRLMEDPGDKVLLVEARELDSRSLVCHHLLDTNPFGLVEGLYVAALVAGHCWLRLALPRHRESLRGGVTAALEEAARTGLPGNIKVELSLEHAPARAARPNEALLRLELPVWYYLAQVMTHGADWFQDLGTAGCSGTRMFTVGGGKVEPRLVEAPAGAYLWDAITGQAGFGASQQVKALAVDRGQGGVVSPLDTTLPLAPEELSSAGVDPAFTTLWVVGEGGCVVDLVRRALTDLASWNRREEEVNFHLTLNALRLVTQISLRRGHPSLLNQLELIGAKLKSRDSRASWPLLSSLKHFREEWQCHAEGQSCQVFDCEAPLVAPCQAGCPAGIDIPSMVALTGQGRYREAVEVIRRDNPLPYICGLVCPGPCETVCLRGEKDGAVSIRAMKAVAARHALAEGGYPPPSLAEPSGKRVAVIGAGPAGLSAAFFNRVNGHEVTVLEALERPGGTMLTGIPAYRLPREVIDAEVEAIAQLGVSFEYGRTLGRDFSLNDLRDQGYDAVFISVGAMQAMRLGLDGEDLPGVRFGVDFLRDAALGGNPKPGRRVAVIGGGNVAVDAARTALRLGAEEVTILYRRTRAEMPAHEAEIMDAQAEGVHIEYLAAPVRFLPAPDGSLRILEAIRMKLGRPDASGRRRPVPVEGSEFVMELDGVLSAIGQHPVMDFIQPGVFAAGDAVTGAATVVEAVAGAKRAARAMDAFLKDKPVELVYEYPFPKARVEPIPTRPDERADLKRSHIPHLPVEQRVTDFTQVEQGLTDQMAVSEAKRCLRCDLCIGCGLCQVACDEMGAHALELEMAPSGRRIFSDFERAAERCQGCGSCALSCPTGAITIREQDGKRATVFTGTVLRELDMVRCTFCGRPFATQVYLDNLKTRMSRPHRGAATEAVCPDCIRELEASSRTRLGPGQIVRPY